MRPMRERSIEVQPTSQLILVIFWQHMYHSCYIIQLTHTYTYYRTTESQQYINHKTISNSNLGLQSGNIRTSSSCFCLGQKLEQNSWKGSKRSGRNYFKCCYAWEGQQSHMNCALYLTPCIVIIKTSLCSSVAMDKGNHTNVVLIDVFSHSFLCSPARCTSLHQHLPHSLHCNYLFTSLFPALACDMEKS